jgi:hemolysin type calcium-binding protein
MRLSSALLAGSISAIALIEILTPLVPAQTVACTEMGTPDDDRIVGTPQDDTLCGLAGNDRINGLGGADDLRGGGGHDDLMGGSATTSCAGSKAETRSSVAPVPTSFVAVERGTH